MEQLVRTRIAPSPTGDDLHIGSVYMALFNYVFARKHKGHFIVRIEDTDRTRYVAGAEERMLSSLSWVGIPHDEGPDKVGSYGPYRQSERLSTYRAYVDRLLVRGKAYYCFCSPSRLDSLRDAQQKSKQPTMYDGLCKAIPFATAHERAKHEPYVVRFNVPDTGVTSFSDLIRGEISFQNELLDDGVLLKSDGYPTYHLAVVIDDHLMQISHVIRGEEWISSTPKHILLYEAFGWKIPYFAHLPLLRGKDKSKLSKRKNPVWTSWFKAQGFLPEAILNFLGTITWAMPSGRDIFTVEEMTKAFHIRDIKTTAPVFDLEKLTWLNGEYIRQLSVAELEKRLQAFLPSTTSTTLVHKLVPLAQERMKTLTEFVGYVTPFTDFVPSQLTTGNQTIVRLFLDSYQSVLPWKAKKLETESKALVAREHLSVREAFMAIRLAVTGQKVGLPLFETMEILGKTEVLSRMRHAV
jgi:glutamyl-tRNA synthetase